MSAEPEHQPGDFLQEDLYILTSADASRNPVPAPEDDLIVILDDDPVAAPVSNRRRFSRRLAVLAACLVGTLATAAVVHIAAQRPRPGPAAPAVALAAPAVPVPTAAEPARAPAPKPAPAVAVLPPAPTAARSPRPAPPAAEVPVDRAPLPPPALSLQPGAACAVLLGNGRFFTGTYAGRSRAGQRFEVPGGHVVVTPDERARVFLSDTVEYARLNGERRGVVLSSAGRRYEGALYVVDDQRIVIGTDEEKLEFRRAEVREVHVTAEVSVPATETIAALR